MDIKCVLMFSVLAVQKALLTNGIECGVPFWMDHASVANDNTTEGSITTYICLEGAFLVDDDGQCLSGVTSECLADGTWSPPKHHCQLLNCGIPELEFDMPFATASYESTEYGATATVRCDVGYEFEELGTSEVQMTCSGNATWQGKDYECQPKECGVPKNLPNSIFYYNGTRFWDDTIYVCDDGYMFLDEYDCIVDMKCGPNGEWAYPSDICRFSPKRSFFLHRIVQSANAI